MPPPDAYHGHSSAPARAPGRRPSLAFPRQQGRARNPLFFGGVLHRFFEDLVLQRLLAQHTLQLDNLGARGCQLGGRHHGLAGGHGHQRALAFELAPLEQQAGGNTFLPGHERHAHAGLIGSPHERRFLGQGPAPAAPVPRDHFDRLCIPSRIHSPTPILKDKRWTVYGHSGGQLTTSKSAAPRPSKSRRRCVAPGSQSTSLRCARRCKAGTTTSSRSPSATGRFKPCFLRTTPSSRHCRARRRPSVAESIRPTSPCCARSSRRCMAGATSRNCPRTRTTACCNSSA